VSRCIMLERSCVSDVRPHSCLPASVTCEAQLPRRFRPLPHSFNDMVFVVVRLMARNICHSLLIAM